MAVDTLSLQEAKNKFTKKVLDIHQDFLPAPSFLRSFFPSEQSYTKEVAIEVSRNFENIAVDVMRGTEGNRNDFSKSTEKVFIPPYYKEFTDLTSMQGYYTVFGNSSVSMGLFTQFASQVAERMAKMQAKIERAYEKQCADVLNNGSVTLLNTTSINFGRVAESMVDLDTAGDYWTVSTADPFADFAKGAKFCREIGKCSTRTFNALIGEDAFPVLQNNEIYKSRVQQNLNNNIDSINPPQKNAVGGTYHGTLSAGDYRINLWTYPESYDVSGTANRYLPSKKVIMIPDNPRFKLGFGAVPYIPGIQDSQLMDQLIGGIDARNYVPYLGTDQEREMLKLGWKSAGIAIPTQIDAIYTMQVMA